MTLLQAGCANILILVSENYESATHTEIETIKNFLDQLGFSSIGISRIFFSHIINAYF